MPVVKVIVSVIILFLLTSCSPDSDSKNAKASLFKAVNPEPVFIGGEKAPLTDIKKEVESFEELFDVAIIQNEQQILVAYKVKHMQRFRMKDIERDLKKDLQGKFPGNEFLVSSDMKIFLEAVELETHVHHQDYPKSKAKKWFRNIVDLEKETT